MGENPTPEYKEKKAALNSDENSINFSEFLQH